ncbi:putative T6SS immunity periplasmic lipoprotein [Serratia quinivorans]|uniref:putative T6SS immunity periplasmic lipoprotein n=1 Tax=Serratia quinivorans TaxID=137545 RepID=UPI0021BD29AF|nr:putative T6SS immunity periplasmic lipoprotein [Serratia quinivorans]
MKKIIVFIITLLLTGCPAHQDPMVVEHPAQVTIKGSDICISTAQNDWKYITSVQLYSESGQRFFKTFADPVTRPIAVKGECLPIFGFKFEPENTYTVYYSLEKSDTNSERTFATRFSLSQDENNRLKINKK